MEALSNMTIYLTNREIESIWNDNKHLLWRAQQKALAVAAADKAIKESELSRIEALWAEIGHALDALKIDELRGLMTDMLRLKCGNQGEVQQVKEK